MPHDSVGVTAAFKSAVSAFKAISDKYPGTDVDSRALSILFDLQQLIGEQKTANEILDLMTTRFGPESVSDAYFELGVGYKYYSSIKYCPKLS